MIQGSLGVVKEDRSQYRSNLRSVISVDHKLEGLITRSDLSANHVIATVSQFEVLITSSDRHDESV